MRRSERDYLFNELDGMSTRRAIVENACAEVDGLSEERILNTDPEELVRYYVEKFDVQVPTILPDQIVADRTEQKIAAWNHFDKREVMVPGVVYTFDLPFEGEEDVFRMRPSTYNLNPPTARVRGRNIVFTISGREVSTEEIKRGIDETIKNIEQYLKWHRELWNNFDVELLSAVRKKLDMRRERLLKQKEVADSLSGLGIRLKEKPNDTKTYSAPAIREKIAPTLPPMRTQQKADPTLDEKQYQTILRLIIDAGRSIERSSSRARELDEETLRDLFLVPLNSHFEGKATGEAFNFSGKTDILIRHEGGNLFVAECKIWSGEKALLAAIDQLLSYLTWRDTKAALIVFSRNAGFTDVVNKLRDAPKGHSLYKSGPDVVDESTFGFRFALPTDQDRQVKITIIGLDLGPASAGPQIRST